MILNLIEPAIDPKQARALYQFDSGGVNPCNHVMKMDDDEWNLDQGGRGGG
jgi:hypothetical protein